MPLRPEEVSELSRLLDEALELDPAQREEWLQELARSRPEVAEHLRGMLQQAESSDTGLLPSLPKVDPDDAVAQPGERVGPYVLVREIGRGGMGSVWLADRADGAYKRRVALKLPRMTWSAGLAKRMARERDIGALLEHPNIARLYDAGVDEHGRPYIAMEYIDGQPIDVYCREHALDPRAKLTLFVQVARGSRLCAWPAGAASGPEAEQRSYRCWRSSAPARLRHRQVAGRPRRSGPDAGAGASVDAQLRRAGAHCRAPVWA